MALVVGSVFPLFFLGFGALASQATIDIVKLNGSTMTSYKQFVGLATRSSSSLSTAESKYFCCPVVLLYYAICSYHAHRIAEATGTTKIAATYDNNENNDAPPIHS
eukprot:339592-Amphidinium_carterae.1